MPCLPCFMTSTQSLRMHNVTFCMSNSQRLHQQTMTNIFVCIINCCASERLFFVHYVVLGWTVIWLNMWSFRCSKVFFWGLIIALTSWELLFDPFVSCKLVYCILSLCQRQKYASLSMKELTSVMSITDCLAIPEMSEQKEDSKYAIVIGCIVLTVLM